MPISAAAIARFHTIFAASAFLLALVIGSALHFHKIVKNDVAQYPDEWFPSVSATYVHLVPASFTPSHPCRIGDWYPERNIFQLFIALTAGTCFQHRSQLVPPAYSGAQVHVSPLCSSNTSCTIPHPPRFPPLCFCLALYALFHVEVGYTLPLAMITTSTTSWWSSTWSAISLGCLWESPLHLLLVFLSLGRGKSLFSLEASSSTHHSVESWLPARMSSARSRSIWRVIINSFT